MKLKGSTCHLRYLREADDTALLKYLNNKAITDNMFEIPYPYTSVDAKKWIEKMRSPTETDFFMAIEVSRELVGGIGIHRIQKNHKGHFGYWLGEPFWNQGIMTEAVRMFTDHVFSVFNLKRIDAMVYPHNPASARILEKNGFQKEGVLRKNVFRAGIYLDDILYAKVKE